ncbi:kdo(2)-lipid A phosphoethanolamine 7''-transferase [Amantichitinum ursilacus]|uniref:Phosphoethanolamine transferase EptB n=1 Tax=Amantichitinum ursilacus TaxID=857265 RepID=A0A0N0XKT8_9NEIS|nr:kdo(2)-lipid A phosphoethanolamine 7''-transferase [Amantichitinum ursilacus]KPC53515.1 Phosphoethanolamine transferase EptB [Amantichitinum ursilacus]
MNVFRTWTNSSICLLLAFYIGVLLNAPAARQRLGDLAVARHPVLHTGLIVLELSIIAVFTFVLLRLLSLLGRRAFQLLASLLVVISAAAAWYIAQFNLIIGYGVIASVLTTDIDLSVEVVSAGFVLWLVAASVLPLLLIWGNRANATLLQQSRHRVTAAPAWGVLLLALVTMAVPLKALNIWHKHAGKLANADMPDYTGTLAYSYLPVNWLSATALFGYMTTAERYSGRPLLNPAAQYTYVAPAGIDQTYVIFIIGETTRWDHMQLFGYDRATTPLLAAEPNLVALRGVSCDTATKLSLRCMFVRPNGTADNDQRTLREKNVFSVLHQLGFSSDLFAMQSEVWFYNQAEPDHYLYREMIAAEARNKDKPIDDASLLPEVADSLARHPAGKHLIVLHTKGSHYQYSQRYPREFARFGPECMAIDAHCNKASLINAFDNSVLYTDHIIHGVIDQVRDKRALVFYAADHGESISDNAHLHATPRKIAPPEQRRVPMLVWASDSFLQQPHSAAAFAQLRRKAGTVQAHDTLFDSVLGCLGYHSPNGGIVAARNWCAAPDSQTVAQR